MGKSSQKVKKEKKEKTPPRAASPTSPAEPGSKQAKVNSSHLGRSVGKHREEMMELFLLGHSHDVENLPKEQWVQRTGIPKSTIQRRWGMREVLPHGGKGVPRALDFQEEEAVAQRLSECIFPSFSSLPPQCPQKTRSKNTVLVEKMDLVVTGLILDRPDH